MSSRDTRYEFKSVHAVRGTETRAKAKWEQAGWEFMSQSPDSMLRTKLTFRRPAPKGPPLLVLAGAGAVLLIGVSIAAFFEADDENKQASAAPTAVVTESAEPSESSAAPPSVQPSQQAADSLTDEPEPAETLEPTSAQPDVTLTADNNADLAALLAGSEGNSPRIYKFLETYQDRTIEFDGNVANMETYSSGADVLILAGNYAESPMTGPVFKFREVALDELSVSGQGGQAQLTEGKNYRVVARLEEFNEVQGLLFLQPVSLTER